jgi:hypothetical protein
MPDSDHEEPIIDVVERHQPVAPPAPSLQESDEPELPGRIPLEADPADAADQAREVQLDEDDYR